jgi:CRISPR-associated protein Csx17
LVNPWDFILMLEGSLLFAAAATRRLESRAPRALSYPFTVRATGAGSGSAALGDESNARAEMWLPLWSASTSLAELKSLLAEGRVTVGRQPARDGLGFIRAISKLGVDRGIVAFQRYAFMMRAGKAYFATPLNRIKVTRNPAADLIDELDRRYWLSRFRAFGRGANATNRIQSLVRRLEDGLFELSLERDYPAPKIQRVLEVLGEAQLYFAHSPAARESCPPVPCLSEDWLTKADDNSPELAIAAALAGLHGRKPAEGGKPRYLLPMRIHLAPEQGGWQSEWLDNAGHQVTWGHGHLEDNLVTTLQRRLLFAEQQDLPDKPFNAARNAPLAAIAAWLEGSLDNSRIASLLPGLTLVRIPHGSVPSGERMSALPAAYRVLKPFFCPDEQLQAAGLIEAGRQLPVPAELVRRLAADDIGEAVKLAQRRLRIAGIPVEFPKLEGGGINGRRLLAALMVPVSNYELKTLLPRRAQQTPEPEMTE